MLQIKKVRVRAEVGQNNQKNKDENGEGLREMERGEDRVQCIDGTETMQSEE